jgi:hypothetical protein
MQAQFLEALSNYVWLAVGLDKLDWRTEKSRVMEVMHLTRNEHQETEGAYERHF